MKKWLLLILSFCCSSAFAQPQPAAYYFSDNIKKALAECSPFSENLSEKNPNILDTSKSIAAAFFGDIDLSEASLFLSVVGPKDNGCNVSIKYDVPAPMSNEYDCIIPEEERLKLLEIMNKNNSTEIKNHNLEINNGLMLSVDDSEFNARLTLIQNKYCSVKEADEEAIMQQMLEFSDEFKNSLKQCAKDSTSISFLGMNLLNMHILGKEGDKCHVMSHGFHAWLNDDELAMSGAGDFMKLLSDEKRVVYRPLYNPDGVLRALSECEKKNNWDKLKGTMSIGDVEIMQKLEASFTDNACNLLFFLELKRNGKNENHSVRCVVPEAEISSYTTPHADLLQRYNNPKEFVFQQPDELSQVDKDILSEINKNGWCKKL